MSRPAIGVLLCGTLGQIVSASTFFILEAGTVANSSTATLSTACVSSIESSVQCNSYLQNVANADIYGTYDSTTQDGLCDPNCGSSLASYHSSVVASCSNDPMPWDGLPAQYYGDRVWSAYNTTCLKDSSTGQYCSNYLANITSSLSGDTDITKLPTAQACSPCVLALGQQIQSTSFSNYDTRVATQWTTLQSTCNIKYPTDVQPLTTNVTDPLGFAPAGYPVSSSCLSGNTYAVAPGDECGQIAIAKGVSTGTLISINNLLPDCSNLLGGATICLPQACTVYNVKSGDTCIGIATAFSVTYTQIISWNPTINPTCTNLIAGRNICVSQPGAVYTPTVIPGATVTKTAISATATVTPPGIVAHGTTTQCGKYYQVQSGDYCQIVALKSNINLTLFEQINPDINSDCSNLVPGLYYCVDPTADWNTNSSSTTTTSAYATPPAPTPSGTTPNCYAYHTVVSGDYCSLIESEYGITAAQFNAWNPSIDAACDNLLLGEAYCVSA